MCGRYSFKGQAREISNRLGFKPLQLEPRYNIAPTQLAPVIVQRDNGLEMCLMKWGLIPFWAKDESIGSRMINARAESLADKPAFRTSFKSKRCLVLADGFYEWKKIPGTSRKQPYRITMNPEDTFVMAGLWDCWEGNSDPDGKALETFTIITTNPNKVAAEIHDRMPAIVSPDQQSAWLDPDIKEVPVLQKMLSPYPSEKMKAYPVAPVVNSPRSDTPECIQPVATQGELFG